MIKSYVPIILGVLLWCSVQAQVTVWTPDDDRRANLELYTLAGMNVFSHTVEAKAGRNDYTIDIEQLSAGMYLVVWQNGSKRLSQKVLIER